MVVLSHKYFDYTTPSFALLGFGFFFIISKLFNSYSIIQNSYYFSYTDIMGLPDLSLHVVQLFCRAVDMSPV